MAGVALGDMDLHFAWQAWHFWHWAGSGGSLGSDAGALCLGRPLLCVAGAALGDSDRHSAWQVWHLATVTVTVCVTGVAPGDIELHFAWQAWHLTSTFTLHGRRGAYGTELALVARLGPS